MKVPTISNQPIVDKNGNLTDQWRTIFNQLLDQMQANVSDQGLIAAKQSTDNINKIASTNMNGAIWYDTTTNTFKVCINGIVKTLATL